MLPAMRKSWLLFALFALFAFTSAIDADGINHFLHRGRRQAGSGTGSVSADDTSTPTADNPQQTDPSASTSTPPPKTSDPPKTSEESTSDESTPTPTPSTKPQPSTQAPSSNAPQTTPAPSSTSSDAKPSSTAPPKTSSRSTQEVRTSALVATSVQQYTTVVVTQSNGQQVSFTSVGSSTNLITTGQALITSPATANGGQNDGGKGITDNDKKIIGGVVGGVGGALLLGGIAIVCWRIWGRKKRVSEDDDDLIAGTGAALGDKPHGANNTATPFQSNLEQYHNPGGRPNAAANF